jgi:hypothetical protein
MSLPQVMSAVLLIIIIIIIIITITIISLSQSTAGHRPFQYPAISLDLRLLASSSCQPSCANPHT